MSVIFSGTNQGRFVSTETAKTLQLRSDVDWLWVKNLTVSYAAGNDDGAEFYWQRGMTQGLGTIYVKTVVTDALSVAEIAANRGFYLVDSSVNIPGPSTALLSISNATPPLVTTNAGGTDLLNDGDIVRIFNTTGGQQLGSMDFTIGSVGATTFTLPFMSTIVAATDGTFRRIPYDTLFYPRNRYITAITQAAQAVVTLSVTHNFTVGQVIRFVVPVRDATYFGMNELNGVQATIVAVNNTTNTITVDVDTTGFTAFAFPLTATPQGTFAQVVPVGENTAQALTSNVNILGDATINTGYIGIKLQAGSGSPAGVAGDVIYWVAGKSFSIDNE